MLSTANVQGVFGGLNRVGTGFSVFLLSYAVASRPNDMASFVKLFAVPGAKPRVGGISPGRVS